MRKIARNTVWLGLIEVTLLLIALHPALFAQDLYGSLTGNVSDPHGAMLPCAKVIVTNNAENTSRETSSSESGEYNLPNLLPGQYTVHVIMTGFETFNATDVNVSLGSTRVAAQLTVGASSQEVTVQALTNVLQTEQSDVRNEISQRSLDDLPTPIGRNYQADLAMDPGTEVTGGGAVRGSNPAAAFYIMTNGVPRELDNVRIDGASAVNNFAQYESAYVPGLDAIQSVTVVSNS